MALEKPTITKTTNETRLALKRASACGLPNRPSERGMKAEDVKKAFWKPFLDANGSLLGELDRVIDEINALVAARGENGEATEEIETKAKTLIGAINEVAEKLGNDNVEVEDAVDLTDAINRFYQKYKALIGQNTLETADKTIIGAINEIKGAADEAADHANANQYQIEKLKQNVTDHDKRIQTNAETLEDHKNALDATEIELVGLRAETQGIARSYVLSDFRSFLEFIKGRSLIVVEEDRNGNGDAEEIEISVEDLKTGDNILIVEHNVPDFWFEKTTGIESYHRAESYHYVGEEYLLDCRSFNSGVFVGLMHVAETDYTVIERHVISARLAEEHAREYVEAAKKSAEEALAVEGLVNSILTVQRAPMLAALNDAILLPTPTLAML